MHLGILYNEGKGVEKDYTRAYEWFLKAAKQNYPEAQFHVARMYEKGMSVEKNRFEAHKWFFKAGQKEIYSIKK